MVELLYIILSPVISAIIVGMLYILHIKSVHVSKFVFNIFALTSPFISFLFAVKVYFAKTQDVVYFYAYRWLSVEEFKIDMAFQADNLSIFMVLFITFVGWLIHIYASGYMKDDNAYGKFFFYFNLFLASMLLLVLGSSPIIMFIGWEGVGVCSYFLISYYYEENENVKAGNKAFILNRVGDAGFVMGMCTLFFYAGTSGFDFQNLALHVKDIPHDIKVFIGVCLFVGAMAKSAQIPLYVWLPDAMAGPTPVSALIHAATMVTAGVYMVSRFSFLYNDIPNVGIFIAYIGAFSSLLAAIIATKQSDIKKILAYSTMSQLGYMFVAVGLANYSGGIFHVFTHAFFKALLFMGAGAVIVALHHEQNIFNMGGLRKHIKSVWFVMLIGCLAISGIPPFSGFFSKDEILLSAFASEHYFIWIIGVVTAFLTAFYMFRMFFIVFYGTPNHKAHHIPFSMIYPLLILCVGAISVGWLGIPSVLGGENYIHHFLGQNNVHFAHISHEKELMLMGINTIVAVFGILLSWKLYGAWNSKKSDFTCKVVENKFYIDEVYEFVFVKGIRVLSIIIGKFLDLYVIDLLIMKTCKGFVKAGKFVAVLQNANIRAYVFAMGVGLGCISVYLLMIIG